MPDKFLTKIRYGGVDYLLKGQSDIQIGTGAGDAAAGNHNHDSTYLALTGGTLTGPLILSNDLITNDKQAATKEYVDNIIAANDAMVFKGTREGGPTTTTYTPAASRGDTYKVSKAGLINGERVEIGDILICITDSTAAATSSNVSTIKNN